MRPDWYAYSAITQRPRLEWPNGARVAVIVTINVETWELERGLYQGGPDVLPFPLPDGAVDVPNYGWREYGHRVGFWRIVQALDALAVPASCTLNALVPERMPALAAAIRERGWEYVAHCLRQSALPAHCPDRESERAMIAETLARLTQAMGTPAQGWLSTAVASSIHTPELVAEAGLKYYCDLCNDDQPYLMNVGGRRLVSIPYSIELNDYPIYIRGGHLPSGFLEVVRSAFDTIYAESADGARLFNLGLHPHVTGQPHRIDALRQALGHIKSRPGIWFATRAEIADWLLARAG
jgi:peptidoglycan/xylan/chitin deacetylase (PgdA/CDA1 family)